MNKYKIDFKQAPIFFKCPLCKNIGFIYIGDVGHSKEYLHKLYRCDNCHVVLSE